MTFAGRVAKVRSAWRLSFRVRGGSARLTRQNLFALADRTNATKTAAGRARKIAGLVAMLAHGETIAPRGGPPRRLTPPRRAPQP